MQAQDIENLESLLTELAECYDRRPPTAAALKNWYEILRPFRWLQVETEMKNWLATKTKFPAISEIAQILNERSIDEREDRWNNEKALEKSQSAAFAKSEAGKKFLQELKDKVTRDKQAEKDWAIKILDRVANGEAVSYIALKMACEAARVDHESINKMEVIASDEEGPNDAMPALPEYSDPIPPQEF